MSVLEMDYECPNCKKISKGSEWKYCEPYCEDCGSHSGAVCPHCSYQVDSVWTTPEFEELIYALPMF